MSNNSQTTTNNNQNISQDDLEFDKLYRGEIDEINKEMGLFLPPKLSPEMTSVWEEFFDVLRYMYAFEVLDLFYIRKYLFDFFEMAKKEPDELERKKAAVKVMRQKAKESVNKQKEILRLFYENQYTKNIEKLYNELETNEEKIEFLTYLNNGEIPAEVQALIDERDGENSEENQLSQEEIDELQRNAIKNIFGKYNSNHGALNLGKGNVVSAEAIDEFINEKETEEAETLRAQTKIRTMPNLPNSNNSSPSPNQTFDQNLRNNQNLPNLPLTNSQNDSNISGQFQTNSISSQNLGQNKLQNSNLTPKNNIQNFGQINSNNSQNNSQNSVNISSPNSHNPKAIPPRTRGLNDLLKK